MFRWSIWSSEHRVLTPQQRRLIMGKWITRGGIIHLMQMIALVGFMLLVVAGILLAFIANLLNPPVRDLTVFVLIAASVLGLHQAIVHYIASELCEETERLNLMRGRLCSQCGYDLHGSPSGVCPECGNADD